MPSGMTSSIAELRASRMTFNAAEAVAIAQQLIASLREQHNADEVHPPYGPPSAENVFLNDDGSVVCRGCWHDAGDVRSRPSSSIRCWRRARAFPAGCDTPSRERCLTSRRRRSTRSTISPGTWRVTAGRSAPTLSGACWRGERTGGRSSRRWGSSIGGGRAPAFSECAPARSSGSRRASVRAAAAGRRSPSRKPKCTTERTKTAAAACLALGLALIGTGEIMHQRHATAVAAPSATIATQMNALQLCLAAAGARARTD